MARITDTREDWIDNESEIVKATDINRWERNVRLLDELNQIQPLTWITPVLVNGWINDTREFVALRYAKDSNGLVFVTGLAKSPATSAAYTTIFTLPAGYRPKRYIYGVGLTKVDTADNIVTIRDSGALVFENSVTSSKEVFFNTICFRAEQ